MSYCFCCQSDVLISREGLGRGASRVLRPPLRKPQSVQTGCHTLQLCSQKSTSVLGNKVRWCQSICHFCLHLSLKALAVASRQQLCLTTVVNGQVRQILVRACFDRALTYLEACKDSLPASLGFWLLLPHAKASCIPTTALQGLRLSVFCFTRDPASQQPGASQL